MASPDDEKGSPRTMRGRGGSVTKALLLLVGAVGTALLTAEGALRLLGAESEAVFTVSEREFGEVPGIFGPGQSAIVRANLDLPHHVSIDSLGYRGVDFPRYKPSGEFRILVVGDSFAFGEFVDDGGTLPDQLGAILREQCRGPIQVINAGLGGSTIVDHQQMMERALDLHPDLVVLQFSENDVTDLVGPSLWQQLEDNRNAKSRLPLSLVYPIVRNTALWHLALRSRAVLRARQTEAALEAGPVETGSNQSIAADLLRERYAQELRRFRDTLSARGLPLVLAVFPSYLSVYDRWESDQLEWLDVVIAELELKSVSFLRPLVEDGRSQEELYLLPYDGHPSAAGYRIAADELASALAAETELGGRCSQR